MPPLPRLALLCRRAAFAQLADLLGTRHAARLRGRLDAWGRWPEVPPWLGDGGRRLYGAVVEVVALGVLIGVEITRQR